MLVEKVRTRQLYNSIMFPTRTTNMSPFISMFSGWFPIELLYQSFGKKFDANSPDHVNGILSHFDEYAGTKCINKIMELQDSAMNMSSLGMSFYHILKLFNLEANADTPPLKAKILPFPKLSFERNVNIMNGSWNLRDVRFYK